ncbi:MAG: radical SAM protein [Bacteroidales bacterium]|nr:radical SAM protein [Bacteroidales bacterium]
MEKAIRQHPNEAEEMKDIVEAFIHGTPADQRDSKVNNVDEFLRMYILPNYICNFSCSYCFSAKGRSYKSLKKEHLKAALDFFIDSKRITSDRLAISYLGGGEPTLSWDVVEYGLEYGDMLARRHGITLMTTIVTNGSRITDRMVEAFNKYNVRSRVSFEILETIQNRQRGMYKNVVEGIDKLSQGKNPPMVRSMITPDNVGLMPEMIEELHRRFPRVSVALFDPITSNATFNDVETTRAFYDRYYDCFLQARKIADKYGIKLMCAPLRNLDMVVERYCTGEFCLTPEGTITICHQISSPNEANYNDCVYAHVDSSNRLVVDNNKFHQLISKNTVYTNPKCEKCFIKWNCGGGCMMQNSQYSSEILGVICDFTRRFSKTLLLERLGE